MLIEYSCENFRSIKDKITLSFLASADEAHIEQTRLIEKYDIRVLRIASIYGANGSGKSSLVRSIAFLKALVTNSINHQPGDKIRRFPHKLSDKTSPTTFSCHFVKNDIRFAYGVSYLDDTVTDEYLYHFKNGRQAKIFERNKDLKTISIGDSYKKDSENAISALKDNRLFLSCAANFSSNKDFETAFLFFKDDLVLYPNLPDQWLDYSIEVLSKNEIIRKDFIDFLKHIGTGIKDVSTKIERKRLDINDLPKDMPEQFKDMFVMQDTNFIEAKLDYGKFSLDLGEESDGIKKLFEVLCPLIDIIINDKILIWDEFESSLHPCLIKDILDLFDDGKKDSISQLFFTTHDVNLLDLKRFRRDQIWFTEINPLFRSTEIFSLAELKNVRKDENVRIGYISGKYGAIPCLNGDIANIFNDR